MTKLTEKTDYRNWTQDNLAKLAFDLSEKVADLECELRHAQSDLKAAIKAYRDLNRKQDDTTN